MNLLYMFILKGSRFYENERKKEQQMNKRIEEQKVKLQQITEAQLKLGQMEVDSNSIHLRNMLEMGNFSYCYELSDFI